jgi:glycosyltransferase involved in cell wall biosynthesis
MRLRFINTFDPIPPVFRNVIPYLAEQGHQIEVIVSKANYRIGDDLDKSITGVSGVRVIKTPSVGVLPDSSLKKMAVMLIFYLYTSTYTLLSKGVDANVFFPQPPLYVFWGYVLRIIRKQPYIFVEMDVFPELFVELSMADRSSLLVRIVRAIYMKSIWEASGIVVIGRCMREYFEGLGVPAHKIHMITNWADERQIFPVDHDNNSFRQANGWGDDFVIMYAGNIGIPQDFRLFLYAAKELIDFREIRFVFVGGGVREGEIRERIRSNGLVNVEILPFSHDRFPIAEILSAGDLHFVCLRENVTGYSVPSKTYSILAAGRPMIYQGHKNGEIARMIGEFGIGMVVDPLDERGFVNAIMAYANNRKLLASQGQQARTLAENGLFSRQMGQRLYEELFLSLSAA